MAIPIYRTASISAGDSTSDYVVTATNASLKAILVTETGAADLKFYDNATESSGDVIAYVPAGTPAGTSVDLSGWANINGWPAIDGITAAIVDGTPGVTVLYLGISTDPDDYPPPVDPD